MLRITWRQLPLESVTTRSDTSATDTTGSVTMTNEQRIAPAAQAAMNFIQSRTGSNRPPRRQATLAVLLSLLHRKQRPVWTRATLAKLCGYKSVYSVDAAIQSLVGHGFFTQKVRTLPGNAANRSTIRRLRYYEPTPQLFALICSKVVWKGVP
jgi:hypothetical protein